jgi:hypothetical protein
MRLIRDFEKSPLPPLFQRGELKLKEKNSHVLTQQHRFVPSSILPALKNFEKGGQRGI